VSPLRKHESTKICRTLAYKSPRRGHEWRRCRGEGRAAHKSPISCGPDSRALAKAETILRNLQEGKTADVVKEFDDRMAKDLPGTRLKPAWSGLVAQFGAFKSITERREGLMEGRQAVELILAFEKDTIVHRTVFDANGRVAGLVFRPATAAVLRPPQL